MIPRVPAAVRAEVIRLRSERLTFAEIGRVTRLHPEIVQVICRAYYGNLMERAKAALRREINLARAEAHTAPLFHPADWA